MSQEIYKIGGSLTANHPSYVKREADDELFNNLVKGEYCYVLNSRQMGKSSLAVQTRSKLLETEQFIASIIDLSAISTNAERGQWYLAVATIMMEYITIPNFNWGNYWDSLLLDTQDRLGELIKQILKLTEKKLVIFLDEIDSVRLLKNFDTDDLFTYIRTCFNARATIDLFNRLTFCLIGVKTPNDFIENKSITSFNIGKAIELKGFTVVEAEPLRIGLEPKFGQIQSQKNLKTIIEKWTNGQPFLTQKLCKIVLENADKNNPDIDCLVNEYVIKNWVSQDNPTHLRHIRDRILDDKQQPVLLLTIYKEILQQGQIEANDSKEHTELRLSGLVLREGGYLQPFNRIYQEVFNEDWVNKQLAEIRSYSAKFKAWLEAKEEIKQRYLLYGNDLTNALKWAENKNILNDDHQFLKDSQSFSQRVYDRFPENSDYEAIINAVFSWTGGVIFLNDIILKKAKKFTKAIERGEEKKWLKDKLISKLKDSEELQQHREEISDRILNDSNIDYYSLLSSYKEILEQEDVEFNDSPEHQKLIDMCLGVKEDGKLKILGKIYRLIFDQKWVEEQLSRLCPYAKNFQAWQASGCQDEYLLKGEDLQKAVEWIQNKDKLNESELQFIITSVVWEKWPSGDAVNKVKEFIPQLQEKTKTPAHLVRVIQAILNGTKPQLVLLQEVLQWVSEAEDIPTKDEAKWLEGVVQRHLKNFSAQKLSEYLDFDDRYNPIWQKLRNENAFIFIDEFRKRKQPSQEDIERIKNYKQRLDTDQESSHNRYETESVTNFQRLISDALYRKFNQAYNMAGQKEFDQLLDQIVANAGDDLEAIIIFDLSEGLPLYHNKGLKNRNLQLYSALFGEEDDIGGEAIEGFNALNKMQEAFNNFGQKTEFGEQKSIHVNFANRKMMIYFHQAPDIPTAICFLASEGINLGNINRRANQVIQNIKDKLGDL